MIRERANPYLTIGISNTGPFTKTSEHDEGIYQGSCKIKVHDWILLDPAHRSASLDRDARLAITAPVCYYLLHLDHVCIVEIGILADTLIK